MVLKHYTQRTLGSNLKNLWLQLRALRRSLLGLEGRKLEPPVGYLPVLSDDFKVIDPQKWRWAQPWGRFHAEQRWWWWPLKGQTPSDVIYPTPDGLALELRKYPKDFKWDDLTPKQKAKVPGDWRAPWAAGLLSSRQSFQWGWFEAEIKLPTERGQWSAFWLSGRDQWPPEIDIFEAYTDEDPDGIRVQPNIHWGPNGVQNWQGGKKDWGAPTIPLLAPHQRWIQYACHWTPDRIQIYYDGYLVSDCRIPEAVKQNAHPQYIILNNGCKNPNETGIEPLESAMLVKNVKVYQHPDWI